MTILPGLVASGGALLFGVNAWCLDGRGAAVAREPARAAADGVRRAGLGARRVPGVASLVTIVLAGAARRASPTPTSWPRWCARCWSSPLQVVGAALRWSPTHPYPVDLRSARATPAPPAGDGRLLGAAGAQTTFTGLIFSGARTCPDWRLSVLVAIPCLPGPASASRGPPDAWQDPVARALVVTTTAA